jgi:hypothetical protein
MGIFYESAPAFRSDVCIVVGRPVDIDLSPSARSARVDELMARITRSLEEIAVEADNTAMLHRVEALSALAAEDVDETRWRVQKVLTEAGHAVDLANVAVLLETGVAVDRAGVPRFSRRGPFWNLGWLALQLPIVAAAFLLNFVPIAGAWLAGRRLADARNTIALWRILVGAPLAVLWLFTVLTLGVIRHSVWVPVSYAAITTLGLIAYPELCIRWPMLRNSFARRRLRAAALAIRQTLLTAAAEGMHV